MVVINEHEGCTADSNDSPQLILRLLQHGVCSSTAGCMTSVTLTGQPVDSFEAFDNLSVKLYRGPGSVPQGPTPPVQQKQNSPEADLKHAASSSGKTPEPDQPADDARQIAKTAEAPKQYTAARSSIWCSSVRHPAKCLVQLLQVFLSRASTYLPTHGAERYAAQPVQSATLAENFTHNTTLGRQLLAGMLLHVSSLPLSCDMTQNLAGLPDRHRLAGIQAVQVASMQHARHLKSFLSLQVTIATRRVLRALALARASAPHVYQDGCHI